MNTTPQHAAPAENVFVARQPIFTPELDVWGYELLFRATGDARAAQVADADMATAKVIADGFLLASQGLRPGQRTLINFPRSLLLDNFAFALPAEIAVVEILEDVTPDEAVLAAVRETKSAGYTVAMDDFTGEAALEPFLPLVDIIKVDVLAVLGDGGPEGARRLREVTRRLERYGCRLLAEKVEDNEVFALCRELGFTLFQGYFFARPEIIPGRKLASGELTKIQLLQELGSADFDVKRLADIIQRDPSLTYRLFRYINSAGMGVCQKVESVPRAIALLGQRQFAQWLRVVIMSDLAPGNKGREVAFLSVHRGRFLELMAERCPANYSPEAHFLLGLFSLLDAMLGVPMDQILATLPLAEELKAALAGKSGDYRFCIDLVRAYERHDWPQVDSMLAIPGIPAEVADALYTQSMDWTQSLLGPATQGD